MEIKEIPTPTMPDWLKLYNTYDPEYYAPGKRVSAEEWNTLFLASVRQGNYNADTLELLIKTYLPETYLTQVDFNQFSNEMRTSYSTFTNNIQEGFIAHKTQVQEQYDTFTTQVQEDFTALTSEVNSLEERVVKAEDVAYSLNDVIQEANEYAQAANQTAIESNTFAQEAKDNASTALETANSAASTAASSNNTAQDALSTAQSAVTTANNAATQATQAVNTANAASLRAEDAIATANAAKTESAAAKNTAAQAETTANASNTTAESANNTASEAKRIAQNALDLVTEGQGSQVIVNGVAVDTFNADTKADLDYVDRQIAALIGAAPETLDTLEEVARAIEENETVVDALNAAIGTKANKADIEPTILFAESERQKSKNLFDLNYTGTFNSTTEISVSKYISLKSVYGEKFTINTDLPQYSFTRGSVGDIYTNIIFKNLKPNTSYTISFTPISVDNDVVVHFLGVYNVHDKLNTKVTKTITTDENGQFNTGYGIWINGQNTTFVVKDIQIEEGTVATSYQPYHGQITHNGDAPVVFAESERQKSKNLFNSAMVPIQSDSLEYNIETNTFIYTITATIESSGTGFVILKYGKLKPGTYTMSFNTTSTIGNTAPVIVAKLNEYDNFSSSIATKNIIDGYVYLTFTITEETNIGLAWYYKAGWIAGDAAPGVKTLTNLQLEEGSVATAYQPYNGAIVHEKQLTEQLSNYLPLSGGTLTGQLKLGNGVAISDVNDNTILTHYTDNKNYFGHADFESVIRGSKITINNPLTISNKSFNYSAIEQGSANADRNVWFSDNTAIGKPVYNNNFKYNPSTNILKVGSLSLTSVPKVNDVNVALTSDIAMGDNFTTYTVIDATTLDENTWYPVTFDASRKNLKIMLFNQWNGGNPSWATHSTKNYGCVKIWETTGNGWGELGIYRKVYLSVFTYTNTDPVRGIGQLGNSSTEYVYVRGGGKYNFYTSHNVVPVLRTSTYTAASQSIAPTTTAPAEIVQTIMSTDADQTISGSKTFTSDIALTKATPLINVTSTGTSGDTSIRFTRNDTGNSCYFGIGSGGVNRGFYDLTQNRWIMYCDGSKSILNSATVPSGQTLTIAGTINLIV